MRPSKKDVSAPILLLRSWIGSSAFWTWFRLKGYWSWISAFSSKIIRHIMYMIKTWIIKIQPRNLIHDNRLIQKIPFKWSQKTKILHPVKNDSRSGSNFLNLNRDRDRLQKYWANMFFLKNRRVLNRCHSIESDSPNAFWNLQQALWHFGQLFVRIIVPNHLAIL